MDSFAVVFVVAHTGIAHAHGRFQSPVGCEVPAVAVAHAHACKPTLEAVVAKIGRERLRKVADVIIGVMGVKTQKMPRKGLFCPPAEFGLDEHVFPLAVITKRKWVPVPRYIHRSAPACAELDPKIDRSCGIVEDIGLQSYKGRFVSHRFHGGYDLFEYKVR